jgi:hypothetical protein
MAMERFGQRRALVQSRWSTAKTRASKVGAPYFKKLPAPAVLELRHP